MKKIKRVAAIILCAVMLMSFAACSPGSNGQTTAPETSNGNDTTAYSGEKINVAAIKGPTAMGMIDLFDKNGKYNTQLVSDPAQIASMLTTGDADIAACPLNVAANLYNKTNGKIKILGINTLGVLYVVTNGIEINKLSDLSGKTVVMAGQGTTAQYITNYILEKNNLNESVKIEYLSEHSEVMTKLVSGQAQIAVLPEPFVSVATAKNAAVKSAISLTDEWNNVNSETELAMGCVVVSTEFAEKNKDAVDAFISDVKKSAEGVNVNAYQSVLKMIENGIIDKAVLNTTETNEKKAQALKEAHAAETVSRSNIVFIDGQELKTIADENFKILFESDAKSIGGKLPDSAIYYEAK